MQQPLRKRMLTAAQFVKRFNAEKAVQQRRYCQALSLWRNCRGKRCRRDQTCRSDQPVCMAVACNRLPREAHIQARQDIVDAMPANIGAPERAARQCMPYELCMANTMADAVAQYLSRADLSLPEREHLRVLRQYGIGQMRAKEEP